MRFPGWSYGRLMSDNNDNLVADGCVVAMHYTLTLDTGETVDSSRGGEPMAYLHGAQNIVPGLESQMTGKAVGDAFDVVVAPEEGYGKRLDNAEQVIPRTELPEGLEVAPGMPLGAQASDGTHVTLFVKSVADDSIVVDLNHPLAGQNLNFAIEIMEVRQATAEEMEHGHPHGPGGHSH